MAKERNITGIITWLVAIVTGMIVIISPIAFFFHSYQNTSAMMETEAEINADSLTHIITANPDYWEFEEIRLTDYLQNRPKQGVAEQRRIVNKKNKIISEVADDLHPPLIMRSAEIMDSGVVVGRIEIYRSVWPLLKQTGLIFLLILPLGLGIFFILRILPIRSLSLAETALTRTNSDLEATNKLLHEEVLKSQRIETELHRLNDELEVRVAERTRQLSAEIDERIKVERSLTADERIKVERSLTASEEKYRNFLDDAPIGIAITDLSGRVQFVNKKLEEATGRTREELLSRDALSAGFFDEETKKILLGRLAARLSGDQPRTTEIPVTAKDGSRMWVNLKTTILHKGGLPDGLQIAFLNVTERKQAEEALQESEKRYRLLIENSSDLFYTISFKGHFIYVSPVAQRIMGWPVSEIVGKHYLSFVRPDFHEKIAAFYQKQYDERIPSTYFEYPIITGEGKTRWIGQNVEFQSVNEKVIGFQAVARDITERKQVEESLRESERKYRFLTEEMTDIVWMTDLNLVTVYASPSVERLLGFTPEEWMTKTIQEMLTPASLVVALDVLARENELDLQGEVDPARSSTLEVEYNHKDGTTRWFEDIVSGIRDERGALTGYFGVSRDITLRREMEEALRESERKYRFITDKMLDVVWMTDMNLRTTYVSPSIKTTLGFTPEERMAQDISEQVTPATLARVLDLMAKEYELEQSGQADPERTVTYEVEYYRKDGSIQWAENVASGVRDERGVAIGFHGVSRDITDRKKAEKALQESEKKYRELVNYLPLSLFEMDMAGNITSANPAILETFRYTQADFEKGLNAFQMVTPDGLDTLRSNMQKLILWERKDPGEYTGIRKDGSTFPFMIISGMIVREGKPVGMRGSIIDLTNQKQAEKELQDIRVQLMQSEKLASMGRLSAGVAHEILNPVNIISLELQILQTMETLSPDVIEEIAICMEQVGRIVTIAENLKQFSRIPAKEIVTADINEVISRALALYSTQLKIDGVQIEEQYQRDLPGILMDKKKIEQVLMNLISNATTAMAGKEKKILRVTTSRNVTGDHPPVTIVFADTGTGIREEDMPKIFEPFFTTRAQGKGTGLGLSISYGIVHDHGGKIWAENNEWGGASFLIELPVKTADSESLMRR